MGVKADTKNYENASSYTYNNKTKQKTTPTAFCHHITPSCRLAVHLSLLFEGKNVREKDKGKRTHSDGLCQTVVVESFFLCHQCRSLYKSNMVVSGWISQILGGKNMPKIWNT